MGEVLTLFDAPNQVFEEVDSDALGRGQVGEDIDDEELVDFILGAELRRELRRRHFLLGRWLNHFNQLSFINDSIVTANEVNDLRDLP